MKIIQKRPLPIDPTPCAECGAMFIPRVVELFGREVIRQRYCDACFAKAEAAEAERAKETANRADAKEAQWAKICPPLYQGTDAARLPADILALVMEWAYGPKGLVICGDTGKCKTRMAYRLLRREFDAGRKVVAYSASDFRMTAAQAAMDGKAEEWLRRVVEADVFYFDDLGQMKMTETSEEMLLTVVEKRTANMVPIIASTQYVGEKFANQFLREDRGRAILRRLREFCQFIAV